MINKFSLVAVTVLILSVTVLYFKSDGHSDASEYELLALADHERFSSAQFSIHANNNYTIESAALNRTHSANRMLVPAINAVAIGKFLNGNLPATTPSGNNGVPLFLSQTGAFSDLLGLSPSPGLIPYEMIEPFWSDGATKKRWMVIPNDGTHDTSEEQITLNDEAWGFPKGAVLIKHFELGGKRLETRFEVKGDDDVYYYLTYKWNDAQNDAVLLNDSVDEDIVVNGVTQSWHYPSRAECASCHFPQNGSVLGPKTRNLNKSIVYPSSGIQMNQLVNLSELGILNEIITPSNVNLYPAVAAKDDLSASIEDRARTYIDVNCASCHNPQVDNVAMFDARYSTSLVNQNIIYGDVVYDEGLNNPKVIIPQDVPNSMAHFRMNSTQTGIEMPPLAKDIIDTEGVQLIAEWINSLTPTTSSPPEAIFSVSTQSGPAPLSINFDASASTDVDGDPLAYSWNFGDDTTAEGVSTSHVYNSPGSYTVTLIVNDGQLSDQETTEIIVNDNNPGTNVVSFTDGTSLIGQDNYSGLPMGVIDMNGDGKDDIVQFNLAKNLRIQYQDTDGQTFTSYNYGQVSNSNQWSTAVADFDQNGYNDILSGGAYDRLKIISNNDGNSSYSSTILPDSNIFIQGSNFVDINNDGWADIFACHDDGQSRAYDNNQNGTFSFDAELIRTVTTPSSDNSGNYASMWVDYDNDGDLDLYISKCRGGVTSSSDPRRINMLMQNDGNNNFTEVAGEANLKIGDQTWLSDFGDIDNDGDLDAIVINHGTGPNLMRNNGDGTFTEVTSGSGLLPTLLPQDFYGIQGFFKDFNNDGFVDLMVSGDNHYIFYNNGDGTFQNAENPFNSNQIQSFSVGDLNHDGFLDIYAGYANGLNTPSSTRDRIWLNDGNSNNYLNVQLKGTKSNSNGIGARVEVYGAWGIQIRDVRSGEGYGLVNSFTQHFGIGVNTQVEKVVVRWPSGIVDEILNPSPNQFLEITETFSEPVPVTSVSLSPDSATIIEGATNQLTAVVSPSDADDTSVSWSSSDTAVATVDTSGLVTAVSEGTATITVTTTDGSFTDTSLITVDRAVVSVTGVTVTPGSATILEGANRQLTAAVSPSDADDTSVTWSSSNTAVATVNTNGIVTAVGAGITTITVTTNDGDFTDVSLITVEAVPVDVTGVTVSPTTATLFEGATELLTATVFPLNADDTSVSWSSSDALVASVSTNGLVTGISVGIATITVTTADGNFTATSTINVEAAPVAVSGVSVTPTSTTIIAGSSQLLTATVSPTNATNSSVAWSSSNPSVATVAANGSVTAIAEGTVTITVTTNDGNFTDTAAIEVISNNTNSCTASGTILMERYDDITGSSIADLLNAPNYPDSPALRTELSLFEIERNQGNNYGARVSGYLCVPETGTYYFWIAGNNHTELNLSSNDNEVDKIRIAHHEIYTSNREWNKFPTQKSIGISLVKGNNYYIEALLKEASFGDNLAVGWRKPSDGDGSEPAEVIPGNVLSPTIPDYVAVSGVSLSPNNVTLTLGEIRTLNATVLPSSAIDRTVSWSSNDTAIVTVDANGMVTAIAEGTATISVETTDGGFTDSTNVQVMLEESGSCSASGMILMERYDDISGKDISNLLNAANYPNSPSLSAELPLFEIPRNMGDNYGVRVSGYLCVPETGIYYFWVAGNNHAELSLSTNDDASNKVKIAHHEDYVNNREWNKFASQKSIGISLIKGNQYYIEALMKEAAFGDNLAVGWRKPSDGDGNNPRQVIPGNVLSPILNTSLPLLVDVSDLAYRNEASITISPNPAIDEVQITLNNLEEEGSEIEYTIYSISGTKVLNLRGEWNETINISRLASGTYQIVARSGSWSASKKLIVR